MRVWTRRQRQLAMACVEPAARLRAALGAAGPALSRPRSRGGVAPDLRGLGLVSDSFNDSPPVRDARQAVDLPVEPGAGPGPGEWSGRYARSGAARLRRRPNASTTNHPTMPPTAATATDESRYYWLKRELDSEGKNRGAACNIRCPAPAARVARSTGRGAGSGPASARPGGAKCPPGAAQGSRNVPSTTVTASPPIQIFPVSSYSTDTRPSRPIAVPWRTV